MPPIKKKGNHSLAASYSHLAQKKLNVFIEKYLPDTFRYVSEI